MIRASKMLRGKFILSALIVSLCLHAQTTIDNLKQKLLIEKNDSARVALNFSLGEAYWFARDLAAAPHYLLQSIRLADEYHVYQNQVNAMNLLANVYLKKEQYDSGFYWLEAGMEKSRQRKDDRFISLLHETYAIAYRNLGDYSKAVEHNLAAVDAYEQSSDPTINMLSVFTYNQLGKIFEAQQQPDKAYLYYSKALNKARTAKENWYIKAPLQSLAGLYTRQSRWGEAQHIFDTLITLEKDRPGSEILMFSYAGLGDIANNQKKYPDAIRYYEQALNQAKEKQWMEDRDKLTTNLAVNYLESGQALKAEELLLEAEKLSAAHNDLPNLSETYKWLAELELRKNDTKKALEYFRLHKQFNDSLLTTERIRTTNNLEVLYQSQQKEKQIIQLQKDQQEKDFAIKKRNIYMGIGAGILVVMLLIQVLLRRNHRNKQKIHTEQLKLMEQQQQVVSLQSMINGQEAERTRIARDLHDGLGGLFSTVKMHFSTLQHDNDTLQQNELFQKSYQLVDTASVEVRRIAHNMMPEVLMKLGLANAVKDLCDNVNAGKLLNVSLEVHGMNERLNAGTEIMLYRIIQELLNNIIKHAQATEAIVQFIKDGNRLSVTVEDNGRGFNTQEAEEKKNAGIETIKSRVDYLNGKLTIDSQKNAGTTVMMDFLINE